MFLYFVAAAAAVPSVSAAPAPLARSASAGVAADAATDSERLVLARRAVLAILPEGSYGRMMSEMIGGSMDAAMGMFDMSAQELGVAADEGGDAAGQSLREKALEDDPHFEERMQIMMDVMGEEMGRIGATMEPAMREGLTRAMARRFTVAELADINSFFATDGGKAFGSQMLMLWVDPEVMKAMMEGLPAMMKEMPAMMKKVEAATAHLPQPKKAQGGEEEE